MCPAVVEEALHERAGWGVPRALREWELMARAGGQAGEAPRCTARSGRASIQWLQACDAGSGLWCGKVGPPGGVGRMVAPGVGRTAASPHAVVRYKFSNHRHDACAKEVPHQQARWGLPSPGSPLIRPRCPAFGPSGVNPNACPTRCPIRASTDVVIRAAHLSGMGAPRTPTCSPRNRCLSVDDAVGTGLVAPPLRRDARTAAKKASGTITPTVQNSSSIASAHPTH